MRSAWLRMSLLMIIAVVLQGCVNAAMTGAQTVYNHKSIQKNLKDEYITLQAYKALNIDDKRFKDANISIATYNGDVLLAGQAPEYWQRDSAEKIVKKIPDVTQVYNFVKVASPSSTLTRISDAWITTKVKSKFLASEDLDATQIKVVTEDGTVYLMGILTPDDASEAADIASETDGVLRVVKIISYMKISKHLV